MRLEHNSTTQNFAKTKKDSRIVNRERDRGVDVDGVEEVVEEDVDRHSGILEVPV